jgi:prophage antirepressor-like protein
VARCYTNFYQRRNTNLLRSLLRLLFVLQRDVQLRALRPHNIRSVLIDGLPWFVVADVCRALGIGLVGPTAKLNVTVACRKLAADEVGLYPIHTPTANDADYHTKFKVASEAGLDRLIMRSDKPEAREFQDWVTREVLPSVRATGSYALAAHGWDQMPGEMRSPTWRRKRTYPAR